MATLPGLPGDVYWGDPETPLPDWREEDDDDGDDDADPEPIGKKFLTSVLGFDPADEDETPEDAHPKAIEGEHRRHFRGPWHGVKWPG
jgi:hypothetical protein